VVKILKFYDVDTGWKNPGFRMEEIWIRDGKIRIPDKHTVNVRISDMARISAAFGLFYVLQRNFEMRHYFNYVKVPKNSQDQCEFEYLFIF